MENQNEIEIENEIENDDDQELKINDDKKDIVYLTKDLTIRNLLDMKVDGDLKIQPDYQRNFVASKKISSSLIESVLLNVPIPTVYLAEESDGSLSVIDGQQRLTSFISFLEGKFPDGSDFRLSGLKVYSDLNRKSFNDLLPEFQKKIKNTSIHCIIIKQESNSDIKFEIFERLNTGSTALNEDELRNTVYRGPYINLISRLSDHPLLHQLIRKDEMRKRMKYRGVVLEFFGISEKTLLYTSPMKQFCNKELRDNRYMAIEKQKEYEERFYHCLDLVNTVFGDKAFLRYIPGNSETPGYYISNKFSYALFHLQMVGFVGYTKNQVLSKADAIREGMLDLMCNNSEFQDLLLTATNSTDRFKRRFRIYMDMLDNIITKPTNRIFPYSVKEQLFNNNPTCAISGQKILKIEDAEVDHIVPYSKGGETINSNAQLVLRYFNRSKNANDNFSIITNEKIDKNPISV
jgi:hypothetical protein